MKHPRLAITIMAAVHLLLFFLLLLSWEWGQGPLWISYCRLAVFSSQGCLLGLWAALGGKPTLWRATAVIIGAAAWGWYIGLLTNGPIATATAVLAGQTFQIMVILLLARFMGLRLSKAERGNGDHLGNLQFSVEQALSWMTALAVFMGATHYLKDSFAMYFNRSEVCLSASWLAVGLATMWLVCGGRWIVFRCSTLLLLIGFGTAWIGRVNELLPLWGCAILLCCEAAVTAASLAIVRLAGYRLVWHWPFRRSKP